MTKSEMTTDRCGFFVIRGFVIDSSFVIPALSLIFCTLLLSLHEGNPG
jgi:hypothetical protein